MEDEGITIVWAILMAALLGATFTAILAWVLTLRNRRLDEEKSRATLFYANKEAEISAREIRAKAELDVERLRADLKREEDRARIEAETRQRELNRDQTRLDRDRQSLDEQKENFDRENLSLKRSRQALSEMMRLYRRRLESISHMSAEEAKRVLLEEKSRECQDELRQYRRELLEKSEQEIQLEAKRILLAAMQRVATRPANDALAALVNLPSEEMKGRIIGREGRNIKSFEAATGATLLIDETPQSILISCFDPVRREVAKLALESLIEDGRIHPASIEEQISIAESRVDSEVFRYGEEAVEKLSLSGVHHDILKLLGKLKYRFALNQNVLDHSVEVAFICALIASELGLDPVIAKRSGLFHDIGKALDQDYEGSHALVGAELLKRHGEPHAVVNAVAAHHEEEPPATVYAGLVIVADTLSAVRPGARTESQGNYLERLSRLEGLALSFSGVSDAYAIQAGREIRVIVCPESVCDEEARKLARAIRQKIEDELQYPSVIKITVIREQRFNEMAK